MSLSKPRRCRAAFTVLLPRRRRARAVWAPLPSPHQVWAHSCVSKQKLEHALQNPEVTAIEVDVAMGYFTGNPGKKMPVMTHPPLLTSDLTFEDFLDKLIEDKRRHVKFDFKDLESVERCLPVLAERSSELARNGQAVWLNADVLPGPGLRRWSCAVPAEEFLSKAEEYCPGAHLSLGWKANPVGLEAYNEADCKAMAQICRHHAKQNVVFAVAARAAARDFQPLADLLAQIPGSQLLFWTGAWEPPLLNTTLVKLQESLANHGLLQRCGFDCRVLDSYFSCLGPMLSAITEAGNALFHVVAKTMFAFQ
ncbi:unnamed protein product [Effrenium voratum]|uniref:Menorin-like domain-containing protein n=1 Tax=Effrenium voratum TaxID=2562239 RepID=A0AA36NEX3_9DINO|nr:unnamed protein product [Effrenium voratum]